MPDLANLDRRLTDVENFMHDIPNLLTTRFGRVEAALVDNTARLAFVERTIASLQTDVRDLRGGVTRQLLAQDARIAEIDAKLGTVDNKLDAILSRLPPV